MDMETNFQTFETRYVVDEEQQDNKPRFGFLKRGLGP